MKKKFKTEPQITPSTRNIKTHNKNLTQLKDLKN